VVTKIEVLPRNVVIERGGRQQLVVIAHLSDGSTRDVTRMTQFEANQPEMADVAATGLVAVKRVPGMATVMMRFRSHVDVFRAAVPLGVKVEKLPEERTFVDKLVFEQLKALGLPPSEPCDDGTFIRRVTIDLCGRLPTVKEVADFAADRD